MTSQSAATLRSRYVEQAASDLQENRRRQRELAEKLKMLEQEEALLVDIMNLAEHYEDSKGVSPLPEQAQSEPVPAKSPQPAKASKPAAESAQRQPLLGTLLMELLAGYDEPRPAKELREELVRKHPDRTPTPQVVRNTLESLVAKGKIRRHKQQRSVMYTLTEPARATPATEAD
ncbi:hypothetical protein ACIRF8_34075 [Streptomyces sp. NPDC102406]|uniref:hypothetical protein n=1 Tax=Streptomyces sp. NPDC102406 TaxID=3366171 RepID=UPI00381185BA